jgi:hypothetical protein
VSLDARLESGQESMVAQPDESVSDPKERESWTPGFSPAKQTLLGSIGRDPSSRSWTPELAAVRLGGEGHAPSWQYLCLL